MKNQEYTPDHINSLGPNEIFVFGSNLAGHHGGGAARAALNKFGAIWGQGVGLQGQSYAIPTMQGGVETIRPYVDEFIEFAKAHPQLKFYVTRIGCGIAGFKDEEIAPLFADAVGEENIILPKSFAEYVTSIDRQDYNLERFMTAHKMRLKIAVLTGAGVSAESGISTFRDSDGLWNDKDNIKLASASYLYENPKEVLAFYNERRMSLFKAIPNFAHIALAELEKLYDITIITQNVDDLHERAGSTRVIHLHGELTKVTSSDNRLKPECIYDYPLDKAIEVGQTAADGSQLRPYVVMFGEFIDGNIFATAKRIIQDADIFVVIGTSLSVAPACDLVKYAHQEVPRVIIDSSSLNGKIPEGFVHIQKPATEGVRDFLYELSKLMEIYR